MALTFTGLAAEAGRTWAGGKSAKRRKSKHRRTRSGREVAMPIPDESTGLLAVAEDEVDAENGPNAATGGV